jgi:CRISPR type IV-associated protein Csf1
MALAQSPEPPFVFLQSTQSYRMIWRTPITVSQDLWYVRLGRQLTVRLLVRKALDHFKRIAEGFRRLTHTEIATSIYFT